MSRMSDQAALLNATGQATQLGNGISLQMVEFLNTVKDQPAGFQDLGLDFLGICKILNSLEISLHEHFQTNQTFPLEAITELLKVLETSTDDFKQLNQLLQKFLDFEKGGAFAMLQKRWRLVFADKDIAKIRRSLQRNKGTLIMTILLTNLNQNSHNGSTGYEYNMLAAKLGNFVSGPARPSIPELPGSMEAATPLAELPGSTSFDDHGPAFSGLYAKPVFSKFDSLPPTPVQLQTPLVMRVAISEETVVPPPPTPEPEQELEPEITENEDKDPGNETSKKSLPELIRIDRSKLERRMPKNPTSTNSPALQKTLISAIAGKKQNIVEQLLDRGVSPDTGPEKSAVVEAARVNDVPSLQLLLEFGADPNAVGNDKIAALRYCTENSWADAVKLLLDYGADPNSCANGVSMLGWGIAGNNEYIVRMLLQHGAEPNRQVEAGDSAFLTAFTRNTQLGILDALIEYGGDPNSKDRMGDTPLCHACRANKPEVVGLLLDNGADPNLAGTEQPLMLTLRHPRCMELLLAAGAKTSTCRGALELATYFNNFETVAMLLDAGVDIHELKNGTWAPLTTAIRDNHPEMVTFLLSCGADPNRKGEALPLWMACGNAEMLKLLVEAGAQLDKCKGIMELAAYSKKIDAVRFLLDAGVDPYELKEGQYAPLTTAVRDGNEEMLAFLLSRGVDPNVKGQDLPVVLALRHPNILKRLMDAGANPKARPGILELAVYCGKLECVQLLVEAGVPVNEPNLGGYLPLNTAVRDNHMEIVKCLLSHGADINLKGDDFPLAWAVRKNNTEYLQVLLDAGADPNAKLGQGATALMIACAENRLDNLKFLLARGASLDITDLSGKSALDWAANAGHDEIVGLLLESM